MNRLEREWMNTTRKSCKQKMRNQDSSCYCIYCRHNDNKGSCTFKSCPFKAGGGNMGHFTVKERIFTAVFGIVILALLWWRIRYAS